MDRNFFVFIWSFVARVALRKESVDRNVYQRISILSPQTSLSARRAWIEMSWRVQRQRSPLSLSARRAWIEIRTPNCKATRSASLSARRAWIEIAVPSTICASRQSLSARRAWIEIPTETVVCCLSARSLSARRAWIEMPLPCCAALSTTVALRKESVDRNVWAPRPVSVYFCRSPQGERG